MNKWKKIIDILTKTGEDKIVVFEDSTGIAYEVKPLKTGNLGRSKEEDVLVDEINKNIAFWQAEDDSQSEADKFVENKPKNEVDDDDEYYLEPVE